MGHYGYWNNLIIFIGFVGFVFCRNFSLSNWSIVVEWQNRFNFWTSPSRSHFVRHFYFDYYQHNKRLTYSKQRREICILIWMDNLTLKSLPKRIKTLKHTGRVTAHHHIYDRPLFQSKIHLKISFLQMLAFEVFISDCHSVRKRIWTKIIVVNYPNLFARDQWNDKAALGL